MMPALAVGILSMAATTQAALITNSTGLPPDGVYLGIDIHQIYGGPALQFLLTLPEHAPIAAEIARNPGGQGTVPGSDPDDEIETFGSTLEAMMDVTVNGNSISGGSQPITASGPFGSVMTIVRDRLLSVDGTGTFDTEMLQLDLQGTSPLGPFMIRESPTRQSLGRTTITDIGGGLYHIDSFFDVFTELSIDGGVTWMEGTDEMGAPSAGHVELFEHGTVIPEPTSMSLLAAGLVGMMGFIRRRR